jgi:hypothetical protein
MVVSLGMLASHAVVASIDPAARDFENAPDVQAPQIAFGQISFDTVGLLRCKKILCQPERDYRLKRFTFTTRQLRDSVYETIGNLPG